MKLKPWPLPKIPVTTRIMKILGSEVPNKGLLLFVGERSYQVIIDLVVF